MNTLIILAIIVLGCVALEIVDLILIMQLMLRLEDVPVAEVVVLPSIQVKEYASSIVAANDLFLLIVIINSYYESIN
jgi:hypothetical protein